MIILRQQIKCYRMLAYRPFSGLTLSHAAPIFTTERLFVAVLVREPHSRSSPEIILGGVNSKCLVALSTNTSLIIR